MREQKRIAVGLIDRDPEQPRKEFPESDLRPLGENITAVGLQIPVIVYRDGERYRLVDGGRRWRACQLVGLKEIDAAIVPEKPTPAALHLVQLALEAHKKGPTAMELAKFLHQIRTERNWSVTELSQNVQMSQPRVSKLLGYLRLAPDLQALLHTGKLDTERAFIISQEPDHAKQIAMAQEAGKLSRGQLRRKANGKADGTGCCKAAFALPGGCVASLSGSQLTLSDAIDVFGEAERILKKLLRDRHDIASAQRALRDQMKGRE